MQKLNQRTEFLFLSALILCSYHILCAAQIGSVTCNQTPCKNGGTCQDTFIEGVDSFTCVCPPGTLAPLCDDYVSCNSSPCMNQGTCQDSISPEGHQCTCTSSYVRPFCTTDCSLSACENGGTCTHNGLCFCPVGYHGATCLNADPCDPNPCTNGGTCNPSGATFFCFCNAGFSGSLCHISANPCDSNPCTNGGTCSPNGATFSCLCLAGFSGSTCEVSGSCTPGPCTGSETCYVDFMGNIQCASGSPCSSPVPPCSGACFPLPNNMFVCADDPLMCLNVPDPIVRYVEPGVSGAVVSWEEPSCSSPLATITCSESSPQFILTGTTNAVVCSCTTGANSVQCAFTAAVMTTGPVTLQVRNCPSTPIQVTPTSGSTTIPVFWSEPFAITSAGDQANVLSQTHNPGDSFNIPSVTQVTYVFEASGAMETCTFEVRVAAPASVTINQPCPNDFTTLADSGVTSIPISWNPPTAVNENGVTVPVTFQSHSPGAQFSVPSTTTVTYVFTNGVLTASCSFRVTVMAPPDPPTLISCPLDIIQRAGSLTVPVPVFWSPPTAITAAGESALVTTRTHQSGDSFPIGSTPVVITLTDPVEFGQSVARNFQVTILPPLAPPTLVSCPADITQISTSGAGVPVFYTPPTAITQNGQMATLISQSNFPGEVYPVGKTRVRYNFADPLEQDNATTECVFCITIEIVLPNPPVITLCPGLITTPSVSGSNVTVFWDEPAAVSEGQLSTLLSQSHTSGSLFPVGVTNVQYVFSDPSNTAVTSTCDFTVEVLSPPVLTTCSGDITEVSPSGAGVPIIWDPPSAVTSQGTSATVQGQTHPSGYVFPVGITYVEIILVDPASGLTVVCGFEIIVLGPPAVSGCPADQNVTSVHDDNVSVTWVPPTAVSTLGITLPATTNHTPGSMFQSPSTTMVMYSFKDPESTLTSQCVFTVTVSTNLEVSSAPLYLIPLIILPLLLIPVVALSIVRYQKTNHSKDKETTKGDSGEDANYVNAAIADDYEEYIPLENRSKTLSKYEDLHEGSVAPPLQYEVRIVPQPQQPVATPMTVPRNKQGASNAYEDVGVSSENRQLPDVPPSHSIGDEGYTSSEIPDRLEEYTGVCINRAKENKLQRSQPIKLAEFQKFMSRNKDDVISDIVHQFMALPSGRQNSWSVAVTFQNKPKNFFKTVLPYDHSRVKLDTDGSDGRSDYINASYIKNHQGKTFFIAAQGPQEGTADDFWKMVWQENVETIVMLTDTSEGNKLLCCTYWPNKVHMGEVYGNITVILMESTNFTSHTVRKLNLLKGDGKPEVHTVTQVHVHSWPYGGVPRETSSLISIIKKVKTWQNDTSSSPMLVHCSNGVGATGAFIAVYVLMDIIKKNKDVNVFDLVKRMRDDRIDMVQTKIQYLFIFEFLTAALQSTDSELLCDQIKKLGRAAIKVKSVKEFKESVVREHHPEEYVGNSPENQRKNRFQNLVPVDEFRPVLKSQGSTFGSNSYVNAFRMVDFGGREFIMTQTPLSSTVEDFWRLVYDYECTTIVMLNAIGGSDETVVQYWPSGGGGGAGAQYGLMTVECTSTTKSDVCIQSQFQVTNKKVQKKSISVDHFAFCGWSGNQPEISKLRQFITFTGNKGPGPVLVHCINGVGLSAVYVIVKTGIERLEQDGCADVCQSLKKLRKKCHLAVQTQEEYTLCYQLLKDHLDNPEEYAVVY